MSGTITRDQLPALAVEIGDSHVAATGGGIEGAHRAVDAGRKLMQAKIAKVSEDEDSELVFTTGADWRTWVEDEADVPYSTSQLYIQLFIAIGDGLLSVEIIAELGQRAARKLIAADLTRRRREASQSAPALPDGAELRVGDARIVLADVADNSVPLILTDPPYGDDAEPLYQWLGMWARRVLIPGGSMICFTGQSRLNRDIRIFDDAGLRYWWLLSMPHNQPQRLPGKFVMAGFKPVLWYVKDHRRGRTLVSDVLRVSLQGGDHAWGQGEAGVTHLIEDLTDPGELIVDPFAGTGLWGRICTSMGRRWIGADMVEGGQAVVVA